MQNLNENSIIKEKKDLLIKINKLISNEVNNKELKRNIEKTFMEKNLNLNTIYCLFNGSKWMEDLELFEQIAIAKVCYDFKGSKVYDYKNYFSSAEISAYEGFISVEEKITQIELEDFHMIDPLLYRGNISYEKLSKYFSNMLMVYNVETQRASSLEKFGKTVIRKPSVDRKTVEAIKEAVLNESFEDTEIILNIRMIEGKTPRFIFNAKYKTFGDIIISPQMTDLEREDYTVVDILDGYHRILAIKEAYDKCQAEEKNLEGSIGVKIVFADTERALRIVSQTFKRSNTDAQFLAAIESNNYSMLIEEIIKNSKELKGKVTNTYKECKILDGLTYKSLLNKTAEYLNIKSESAVSRNFEGKKYARLIDDYIEVCKYKSVKKDVTLSPNIFAAILAFGHSKFESGIKTIDIDSIMNLKNNIENLTEKEIKDMKLNQASCSISKIASKFGGLKNE